MDSKVGADASIELAIYVSFSDIDHTVTTCTPGQYPLYCDTMANITLTNQTNSPVRIDTTHFGVGVPTSANLVGTGLQIAEVYAEAGLGRIAPAFTVQPSISLSEGVLTATYGGSGTPSYVWEVSEDEEGEYVVVPGATDATLAVEVGGWYRVVVTLTAPYGSATDQSAPLQVIA